MSSPLSNGEVRRPSVNTEALRQIKSDPGKYFDSTNRRLTFGFASDSGKTAKHRKQE